MALDGEGARIPEEFPDEIASHGKGKGVKGDRGVSRAISKVIFQRTGILVPLGSGVAFMNPIAKKVILLCNICALCIQILLLLKKCNFSVDINYWLRES